MFTTAIPSSRQRYASGYWVIEMTSQPASLNHFDSALVEKRGPLMMTIVPPLVDVDPVLPADLERDPAQLRVVDVGRREMGHDRAVEERVLAAAGPVDELVAEDEVAGLDVTLERAGGARRDHRLHAERAHRPDVGAVVDQVGRDRVAPAVARQERDAATADRGQEERVGRRAVRRVDLDLADVVEQRVEPRTAEHADLRLVSHAAPPALLPPVGGDSSPRPRDRD